MIYAVAYLQFVKKSEKILDKRRLINLNISKPKIKCPICNSDKARINLNDLSGETWECSNGHIYNFTEQLNILGQVINIQ
jgi:transposase-like protein